MMQVMPLSQAVMTRLAERRTDDEALDIERQARAQLKDQRAQLIAEELRLWFCQQLRVVLPEDVDLVVDGVKPCKARLAGYVMKRAHPHLEWHRILPEDRSEVDFKLQLRGHAHRHIVFPSRPVYFIISGEIVVLEPLHWYGVGNSMHQVKHEKFIDAVIFALGGERGLRELGVIA